VGGDERPVDLAVIGGGITGAAVARDASLRGLSVVLFEKGDFSSGTTSKSSRLIHGGLRYLEGFQFRLVYESLRERDWLSSRLPHLIRPVPILIPVYRGGRRGMGKVWIGMRLYDFLARGKETPRYGTLPAKEVARRVPGIRREGLSGGALFYDYQLPVPERLVVENLLSASGAGARVQNRTQVEAIGFEAGAFRLRLRDLLTGAREEAAAAAVVNATGPWADRTRRLFGLHGEILYPTKGAHLVFPGIFPHALFAASPKDDRMFYIFPLAGSLLVGTTDMAYPGDPDAAETTDEDVDYLRESAEEFLPGSSLLRSTPSFSYAGVRPLLRGKGATESHLPRKHGVFREGPGGRFLTVAGGKMTTFRKMAEDVVDAACAALGRKGPCTSREAPFPGEIGGGKETAEAFARSLSGRYNATPDLCRHLVSLYGRRAERVLEIAEESPALARPLSPHSPDIAAQVVLASREEWARTPQDAILRRMHLGITKNRGREAIPAVERLLAGLS
jgi:glycerol-3-phosphate dehydrogenase